MYWKEWALIYRFSSSTAPLAASSGSDLFGVGNGDGSQRKSSSETRTSSSPDESKDKKKDRPISRSSPKVRRGANHGS